MKSTEGLFVCAVGSALLATVTVGWPAVFGLLAIGIGYMYLSQVANGAINLDGSRRRRRRRRHAVV